MPSGTYVDATFGRGGHSRAILRALGPEGRLVAVDRDPAADAFARSIDDPRFSFRHAAFSELPEVLSSLRIVQIDGALFDLGVSSPQLDDPARGFSYRHDGPLDMRMDTTRGETAAQFIARADVRELTEAIRDYGEERFAQSIARAIAAGRARESIVTTRKLRELVSQAVGARTRGDWSQDPAARTFQALRIAVNRELAELSIALPRVVALLAPRARLAVISFHSLEDRIVKRFISRASKPFGGDPRLSRLPIKAAALPGAPLAIVGRTIKAKAEEVEANPRARSAVLRVAERTEHALPADFASSQGALS
jgi:16S rRNA (cytosine1402-N4)-methyltransferase